MRSCWKMWVCVAGLAGGCTISPRGEPRWAGEEAALSEGDSSERGVAEAGTRTKSGGRTKSKSAERTGGKRGGIDDELEIAKSNAKKGRGSRDRATERLIEAELAEDSPEERARWKKRLDMARGEEIPRLLQEHRDERAAAGELTLTEGAGTLGEDRGDLLIAGGISLDEREFLKSNEAGKNSRGDRGRAGRATDEDGTEEGIVELGEIEGAEQEGTNPDDERSERPRSLGEIGEMMSGGSTTANPSIKAAIGAIEKEIAGMQPGLGEVDRRKYITKQVELRMLYLLGDERQRQLATQAIPGIPSGEQEYWSQMLLGLDRALHSPQTEPSVRSAEIAALMQSAMDQLQMQSKLELVNVNFCERITGFGNYERYARDEFRSGETVLVYAEVRNFASEATRTGEYLSRLRSTVEIYQAGPSGTLMDRNALSSTEDLSRSRRRDYFLSYRIDLPSTLAAGAYIVKISVEDEVGRKTAEATLNFSVR